MMNKYFSYVCIIILSIFIGCNNNTGYEPKCSQYISRNDWAPDVKDAVNDLIKLNKNLENKYVVFDFDNTCSIFDIEEQLMVYQIQTMSFALNPSEFKKAISTGLENAPTETNNWITDIYNAYSYLYNKYGPFTAKGLDINIQNDPQWLEFAAKMGAMYKKVGNWLSTNESYNWILYMFAGMTDNEVYSLSYKSWEKFSKITSSAESWVSPETIPSLLGEVKYDWTSGVSVTQNIMELFKAFNDNGIDVWICSASGIEQVKAVIDATNLHRYCTGLLAMTLKKDDNNKYVCQYDIDKGTGYITDGPNKWKQHNLINGAQTSGAGKVKCILNAISPLYNNEGPIAGFMDSTGDFNFCTEFKSLQLVICFNRANRKITDGGGLIAEIAMYEKNVLKYDFTKAFLNEDTFYVLQGRDENGLRTFRPSNSTIRLGETTEKLFANEDNYLQLEEIINSRLTVKEAIDKYSSLFLDTYPGYHSR